MAGIQAHQILATWGEFGDWEKITGGEKSQNQTDYTEAGKKSPIKLAGTFAVSDVTLERIYDPVREAPIIEYINKFMLGKETSRVITKKYLNSQMIPSGRTSTYINCQPKSYMLPDGEAGGNNPAMFRVVLGVEDVT